MYSALHPVIGSGLAYTRDVIVPCLPAGHIHRYSYIGQLITIPNSAFG